MQSYMIFKTSIRIIFDSVSKSKCTTKQFWPYDRAGRPLSKLSLFICFFVDISLLVVHLFILIKGKCELVWVLTIFIPCILIYRVLKLCFCRRKWQAIYQLLEVFHAILLVDVFFFGNSNSTLAKAISAIVLFFIWFDFMSDVVILASYSSFIGNFKIYMMMLQRVFTSFLKVIFWYIIFFIIFGLGFHILFQRESDMNDDQNLFQHQISSIMKTFSMFTGEVGFDTMAINITKTNDELNLKNAGWILSYAYVLLFIFVAVIVLMNLLNAIAIQDAQKIRENAKVLEERQRIDSLVSVETMCFMLSALVEKMPRSQIKTKLLSNLLSEINLFHAVSPKNVSNTKCTIKVAHIKICDRCQNITVKVSCCNSKKCPWHNEYLHIKASDETMKQILGDTRKNLISRNKKNAETFKTKTKK